MRFISLAAIAAAIVLLPSATALAQKPYQSSARKAQASGTANIPVCTKRLGIIAIVEPDNQWWREFNLGSPEAILRVMVQKSGCFTLVNRGRSMGNRAMERALADQGELQEGSNIGRGQVRAADYFLQPDIVSSNRNAGGNALGGVVGGLLGGRIGRMASGINTRRSEANVTLSIVNARTTEEEALTEGFARKSDLSFNASGALWGSGGFGGVSGGGYENTEIGQVIVLAYLDAYTQLVTQLGGLPTNASAAAPRAK